MFCSAFTSAFLQSYFRLHALNGYRDISLHNVPIQNINYNIGHIQVLQEVLTRKDRVLTLLDLTDIFGSVSHSLIETSSIEGKLASILYHIKTLIAL